MSRRSAAHDVESWKVEVRELRQNVAGLQSELERERKLISTIDEAALRRFGLKVLARESGLPNDDRDRAIIDAVLRGKS